ncbi:MAG: hypothetical protein RLZZ551_1617, partial [Actinomycetota bacterium]
QDVLFLKNYDGLMVTPPITNDW